MAEPVSKETPRRFVDLMASGRLPPMPTAFLSGKDQDLLAPLVFVEGPDPGPAPLPKRKTAPPNRKALATGLERANASYGHSKASELARKLADPATRVVVTGQQTGLFGGPLYTLSKMAAAVRWAEELEARGESAVAVFWMATEDHDWQEVASASFLSREGVETVTLGEDPEALSPVGMRVMGSNIDQALDQLDALGGGERHDEWLATLRQVYRPDVRFGEAFGRWATALLGGRCPLLLDAMLPELKAAELPWMRRLIVERAALDQAYAEADQSVEERGYFHQVSPSPGTSPLFLLRRGKSGHGERRRIVWTDGADGERFSLRGEDEPSGSVEELLETLDANPGVVSPGVLARPAIQDAVLGTSLLLLGPGELSYLPQAAATYRHLGIEAPAVALRPQVLILEEHHRRLLDELETDPGLSLDEVLGDMENLDLRLADRQALDSVAEVRDEVETALARLAALAGSVDSNLERPLEKTRQRTLQSIDLFAEKLAAASARRDEVRRGRLERLRRECLPAGRLQERLVSSSHFPRKYGRAFGQQLLDGIELDSRRLQVIDL